MPNSKHVRTDGGAELAIVRMAADGVWLTDLSGTDLPEREVMRAQLIAATRPVCKAIRKVSANTRKTVEN